MKIGISTGNGAPPTTGRILLAANAQRYLDAVNGSDSNDGLTPATAWKTRSHAWTTFRDKYDIGGQQVTCSLLTDFHGQEVFHGALTGLANVTDFIFDGVNHTVSGNGGDPWIIEQGARFSIQNMRIEAPGYCDGVVVNNGHVVGINLTFANCGSTCVHVPRIGGIFETGGAINVVAPLSCNAVFNAEMGGYIALGGTCTTSGGSWGWFLQADLHAIIEATGVHFGGSGSGGQVLCIQGSVVHKPGDGSVPPGSGISVDGTSTYL